MSAVMCGRLIHGGREKFKWRVSWSRLAAPSRRRGRAVFTPWLCNDLLHPPGAAGRVGNRAPPRFPGRAVWAPTA